MALFGMPQLGSKIVNADGTISRDWFLFLSSIFQAVGGPSVVPGGGVAPIDNQKQFEEYALSVPDAVEALRGIDELRNEIAISKSEVQALRSVVDDLLSSVAVNPQIGAFRNRIESLEDRLA